ncbi:DENN domain-containing protein, partial [Ochromonadaceae sp. CCMP2298]
DVSLLPLFDALGVDRFFKLLSALLCERRVVVVAEDAGVLSGAVLAAASMLHPFHWHHTLIPILPEQQLSVLLAQSPYLIGVRRNLLPVLARDYLDGVVLVDADSGEV